MSNIALRLVPYEDQVVEDVFQREMKTGINATTDKDVTRPPGRREIARGAV